MANRKATDRNPYIIILGILIINFLGLFSETSLNIALPVLRRAFNVSSAQIQWLVISYILMVGLTLPLSTLISHWFKTRNIILFSILIFGLGAIIAAISQNYFWLLFGRTIQGIGTGLFIPLMFTIAALIFPSNKLGIAMGLISVVMNFAPAIGPTLSGVIINYLSWRWIFWLFLPFLFLAFILDILVMPNIISKTKPSFNWLDVIYSLLGFGLLVTAIGLVANLGWHSPIVVILLIASLIILYRYVKRQIASKHPILDFTALKQKTYRDGSVLVILNLGIILGAMYLLPQILQNGLGYSANLAGWIMLPAGILNAIFAVISGKLYDSYGAKKWVQVGSLFLLCGGLMLAFINLHSSIIYIILAQSILLMGDSFLLSPAQSYTLNSLKKEKISNGSTLMNTFQQIIGAISTSIVTTLLVSGEQISQSSSQAGKFISGSHLGFVFVLLLVIIIIIFAFQIKEKPQKNKKNP